jgi:hypothetical protein
VDNKWKLTIGIIAGLVLGVVVGQLLHDPDFTITMSDAQHATRRSLASPTSSAARSSSAC